MCGAEFRVGKEAILSGGARSPFIIRAIKITIAGKGDSMNYDFQNYICGVTKLPCCGCSLFCEHRRKKEDDDE